jgi:hypothetical protein
MVVAVRGSWQSHCHSLDLQETNKTVWVDNSGWHGTLLVLIVDSRASVELGLLDNHRRGLWTVVLKHAAHHD